MPKKGGMNLWKIGCIGNQGEGSLNYCIDHFKRHSHVSMGTWDRSKPKKPREDMRDGGLGEGGGSIKRFWYDAQRGDFVLVYGRKNIWLVGIFTGRRRILPKGSPRNFWLYGGYARTVKFFDSSEPVLSEGKLKSIWPKIGKHTFLRVGNDTASKIFSLLKKKKGWKKFEKDSGRYSTSKSVPIKLRKNEETNAKHNNSKSKRHKKRALKAYTAQELTKSKNRFAKARIDYYKKDLASNTHKSILNKLDERLKAQGYKTESGGWREDGVGFAVDLFAERGKKKILFEIKSCKGKNRMIPVLDGFAQLLWYKDRLAKMKKNATSLVLVLEKKPPKHVFEFMKKYGIKIEVLGVGANG